MFGNKLKKLVSNNKEDGDGKKKIENMVFFIVLLIITIVAINIIWNDSAKTTDKTDKKENVVSSKQLAKTENKNVQIEEEASDLKTQLENILSKIQGVGEVHVFINYSESSQIVAMYNENTKTSNTEENDTSGGTRKIQEVDSQKDVVYEEDDGVKKPVTQKVIQPRVEGAIVTAKGAENPEVKSKIIQAVEAVTGLATHKVQVFETD